MQIKKIRNRKNVHINLRNKKINVYYKSTVKTLNKKIKLLINEFLTKSESPNLTKVKQLSNLFTSKLDKAVKKGVIKKNTASRKKSSLSLLLKKNFIKF